MNARNDEQSLAVQEGEILDSKNQGIIVKDGSLDYENFIGLWRLSKLLVMSGMVPKVKDGMSLEERTSQIAVSIARGRCVGLDAFQSVESIMPINGRPMIWGNAPLAICRQSPNWVEDGFDEYWEVKGERQDSYPVKFDDDTITAVCQTMRKGSSKAMVRKFSVADAKRAGLWGASGKLYGSYPQRMLPARARAYNLNDNFGDSLKGIQIRETFDEEVDVNRVSNVDELREQIDKRKKINAQSSLTSEQVKVIKESVGNRDAHVPLNNSETIKEAVKQSFPDTRNETVEKVIKSNVSHVIFTGSDIEDARNWIRTVFEKIPIRMGASSMLKDASLRDGKWISYENIENIDDVEYLNSIAANLEDALKTAVGAKA